MKLFIIATLTLSTLAFASGDKFETMKAKRLQMIETAISNMNKTKACMTAASNKDALKACGKERKAMRESMKAQRKLKKSM